jgi:excisionase family DNA binding protein
MKTQPDQTTELLHAILSATADQRLSALRLLKGKATTTEAELPLLYSVTEAAARLNISRCSVWRAIRAGRLKKIELYPGFERLRRADVEALAGGVS